MSKTPRTEKVEISMLNTHHTAAGYAYFFYHTNQFFSECEQYFHKNISIPCGPQILISLVHFQSTCSLNGFM